MKKLLLSIALIFPLSLSATIILPDVISDGMVLQQQTNVQLWGQSTASELTVTASWGAKQTVLVEDGWWEATLPTPAASYTPYQLTFLEKGAKKKEAVTISDVLIGEVWLGGGQSNMEMPINGFGGCPITNANQEVMNANQLKGKIRYLTVQREQKYELQDYAHGVWKETNMENIGSFGATAFFFAKTLQQTLDIPIGIINCSWGGSRVEAWLPREILATYPEENLDKDHIFSVFANARSMVMYNTMLYPLRRYAIKGCIWYQGCANVGHADVYPYRLAQMVTEWRRIFNNPDMPFFFTEIAPFGYSGNNNTEAAELRESQWKLIDICPNTDGICTNDLVADYEFCNIHPCNKQDVGQRLAFLALNQTYGMKQVDCQSPRLVKTEVIGRDIYMTFAHADNGFNRVTGIQGFEILDNQGKWVPAQVRNKGWRGPDLCVLIANAKDVYHPQAISYCYRNYKVGNLTNMRGLPLIPFREQLTPDYKKYALYPEGNMPLDNGYTPANEYEDSRWHKTATPELYVFLPKGEQKGVLVSYPGGGYGDLAFPCDESSARWLAQQGYAVVVTKYRLPNGHPMVPLTDACNAIAMVRKHGQEWGIDTSKKLGVIGYSAGAHLAGLVATSYLSEESKPDYAIICYAPIDFKDNKGCGINLVGNVSDKKMQAWTLPTRISEKTVPCFIAASQDDSLVPCEHSSRLYKALLNKGVHAQLLILAQGQHGWNLNSSHLHDLETLRTSVLQFIESIK